MYESALTLKQSYSIDKNPKLIKERVALRKAIESHLDIKPIKEFGKNYAEGYHDGKFSIQKLLTEAKDYEARKEAGKLTEAELEQGAYKGQVAGAFYKEGLGDIDLVWGEVFTNKKGEIDGFGLSKILEKHAKNGEFRDFGGESAQAQMQNALLKIIDKGEIIDENGRVSIVLDYKDKVYRLGLKQNWKGEPTKNKWIITAYEDTREANKTIRSNGFTKEENLSLNSKTDYTTNTPDLQTHPSTLESNLQFDSHQAFVIDKKSKEAWTKILQDFSEQNIELYRKEGYSDNYFRMVSINELFKHLTNFNAKTDKEFLKESYSYLERHIKDANKTFWKQQKITADKLEELRQYLQQRYNIKPIPEFGKNYAEYIKNPYKAIEKILLEKQGQVAGAFYREELGDIDLVWGDSHFGLQHILERRGAEIGEEKAIELIRQIPQILQDSKIYKEADNKIELITDKYTLVLGVRDDKKFVVSTLRDRRNPKKLETIQTRVADDFTSETLANKPLSQNQQANSTIDSKLLSKVQSKFKYDEKKAKDLLEWHKDSSPITKDKDGLPKVFYHGSNAKDLEEFKSEFDQSGLGFWFNADENRAKAFAKSSSDKLYPVFLYIKKPFDLNQSITTKNVKELSELLGEDLHKYIATDKQSLQKELDKATKSKDFAVIEGRGLMLESNKKTSEYAYAYNGKWYVNLYNETDLQREGLQKLLPFMQKAQNLNQTKTITELLNEKEMGEYQKNTHTFLQKLKTKGYDSILPNGKAKNDDIVIFDSKQIKHINNKGSYTDSNGNITATKPKGVEAKHKYFNEGSPNIYQSNAHIGSGMLGGSVAGVESDENGNIVGFDPSKFALGFLGGAVGSKALSQGFKVLKDNPQRGSKKRASRYFGKRLGSHY